MTLFELVKIALDALYEEGVEEYGEELDENIKERLEYLANSYGDLKNKKRRPINYRDPATRFAYVYKYVPAHGDYLVQILKHAHKVLGGVFHSENVRVSCVGGGPGSDIIAVLKYLDEEKGNEPVKKVTCYLLDREQAWADTWTELGDSLNADIELNVNFQPLDVLSPDSWKAQKKFFRRTFSR